MNNTWTKNKQKNEQTLNNKLTKNEQKMNKQWTKNEQKMNKKISKIWQKHEQKMNKKWTNNEQAEVEAEADAKGSGRDRGSNDFLNTFYKVTKRHTGLGDATPQKNALNKCFKQMLQKNA